jgi:AraC-like DNA-binding protein
MVSVHRAPLPALRGLVASVWAQDMRPTGPAAMRERVLPTGATHIALRIGGPPLLLFDDAADRRGHSLGHAVVGGARTSYHVRDVSQPSASVGAMLRPGAARVLLGVPEAALAGHHTPLEQLLPAGDVQALLARLHGCAASETRLALFERWLVERARGRQLAWHAALAPAFSLTTPHDIAVAAHVRASGLSHRHYIALFRQATGMAPREWLGLQRFSHALALAADTSLGWADIAAASGFADQAHLANSFRSVAGITPTDWRRQASALAPRHVAC